MPDTTIKKVESGIEPTGKDPTVTRVGKDSYQTEAEANADLKRLCKEPEVPTKPK